jgi:putative flavoprotein involved in K+ transport
MSTVDLVDTVVIGAGHAGLATSRLLTQAGHDHVVLERGRVGERWRSERWDSLRLLTPNWMLALPGSRYGGPDPDGFAPAAQYVEMLEEYAASFAAPVVDGTTVEEVRASGRDSSRFTVSTDAGTWHAGHLVIATGPHGVPVLPAGLDPAHAPATLLTARDYRSPAQVAPGGVLVVGASASGVQIADELQRAGRQVTLAVGRHTRMPRSHRGFDIYWWLEATGRLRRPFDGTRERSAALSEPSMQLVGRQHAGRSASEVDLAALQRRGVRLTGRLREFTGGIARFADDLASRVSEAEARMHRFLDVADAYAERSGLVAEIWRPERPAPVTLPSTSPTRVDLRAEGIDTIVVASGYRPDHPWLQLPVLTADGWIGQHHGVTAVPGVYTVGQRGQHGRASGTIAGAAHDAAYVVDRIAGRTPTARLSPEEAA